MTASDSVTKPARDVKVGDRLRLDSGRELTVTRITPSFLGHDDLVCFVEDSETQWLAYATWVSSDVQTGGQTGEPDSR
jgi:hypothetical protein